MEAKGLPVNNTRRYDGMIGLLQSGEIEIASSGLIILAPLMDVLDYAGETVLFE